MIAVIGENVVDLIAQRDGSFLPYLGGSPFNVAIGLGKLGQSCSYLSPLSQDAFGDQFSTYLQAHNVVYGLQGKSPYQSSLTLVTLDRTGQPEYNIYRQKVADRDISAKLMINAFPKNLRILHTGSLALEPEDLHQLLPVIQAAKQKGAKISVDLNVRMEIVSDPAAFIKGVQQLLPFCNYIKASDQDLLSVFPNLDREDAIGQIVATMDEGIFAFTEGEFGASLITSTQRVFLPAIKPLIFVDTIGAGDTFYAALLASIMNDCLDQMAANTITPKHLKAILYTAIVAASINLCRPGCVPPDKTELTQRMLELAHLEVLENEVTTMMTELEYNERSHM